MEQGLRKWIIVITVIISAIIELIDSTIVNVSINTMSGNLGATLEDTAWVITSYAIANVIIIPMTSFLAETFGRKQYYIVSILIFTLASALCGMSDNLWELVFFRFCQGIGGGALLSTSQAILFDTFEIKDRPLASGIFSLGIIIGPSIGPVMGGYIVDNYQWQWIFYVNIPIGILAASLCYIFIRATPRPLIQKKIDWWGIGLLIAGVGCLQVVLERGQPDDWFEATYIIVLSVIAFFSLLLLIWRQLSIQHPVINLKVLKSGTLSIAALMTFVFGYCLLSALFVFPLYTQRVIGYTAFQTGSILLPGTLMAAMISPFLGKMIQRGLKPQYLIISGFGLTAVFCFLMSRSNLESGDANFLFPLILRGIGAALLVVPLTALAVSELKPMDIPQGAAINNMMRQMGGSFGIALTNTFIAHREALNRTNLVSHVTADNIFTAQRQQQYIRNFMAHGSEYARAVKQSVAALELTVVKQTVFLSYMDVFSLLALLNLICIPLVIFTLIKRKTAAVGSMKIEIPDAH